MGSDDGTCDRTEVVKLQHPPPPQPPSTSTPFPPPDPSVAKVESRKDPISSAGEQTSEVPGDGNICILTARRKSLNCARGRRVHFGASEATGEADDGDVHIEVIEIPNRFEEDRSPSYCPAVDFYWQHPCELESPANDEFELDDLPGAMIEMPARSYTASTSRVRRPRRRRMAVEESATSTDLQLQRHLQMHSAFVPSRQRRVSQMPADIEYFHKRLLMTAALKPHASRRLSADFDASDVLQVKKLEGTQRVLARGMQRGAIGAESTEEASPQQLLQATKQKLKQRALDKKVLARALPLQASSHPARSSEVLSLRAAQSKATNSQLGADRVALAAEERTPRIELVSYLTATTPANQTAVTSGRTLEAPHSPTPPAGPAATTQQAATPTAASTVSSSSAPLKTRVRLTLALQSEPLAAAQMRMQSRSVWDPRTQPHTIEIAQLWS